ncbi:uncharacterized protein LOC116348199 [Contarinia nasturtii]|uniref:uncharacterized protein LOC116348199 n=1 Tax=Contarinia nasturtii TaxID=265458 RepID=UPI0012D39938|nr:uncharacterized protein LOC116348199 [Contarinia nasturtii]XP_031634972.1 uncharacterized protein LOC116348199 [Contarinia nasturtii]
MFRIISKLNFQRCLAIQRMAQFCSVKNEHPDVAEQLQRVSNYYRESDRHNMFKRNSGFVYKFDNETRNLVQCPIDDQNIELDDINDKLIHAFSNMLTKSQENNIQLSDKGFDQFIDDFCDRMEQFTLNEVIRAMQIFANYPLNVSVVRQRNGVELFYAFDQACSTRSRYLLASQLLFISSIWLSIPCSKQTHFSTMVPRILNRYMKGMNASELAQAFLYINCWQKPIEDIRAFENVFENVLDDMTIEEFATVLWTFIRLDTKIEKQELRKKYFDFLAKKDLNQLADTELLKVLTITSRIITLNIAKSEQWTKIVQNLRKSLSCASLKKCILISNVGISVRAFDDDINWHLFNRCLNNRHEL